MKRRTQGLAGILVAGCITVASPVFADTAIEPRADEVVESFFARVPDDVIAISHGGGGPIALFPADIPTLHEPGVDNGVAILTKFRNRAGERRPVSSEVSVTGCQSRPPAAHEM